jgi:hypothetical protein
VTAMFSRRQEAPRSRTTATTVSTEAVGLNRPMETVHLSLTMISAHGFQAEFDRRVKTGEFHAVEHGSKHEGQPYTTAETLRMKREILGAMRKHTGALDRRASSFGGAWLRKRGTGTRAESVAAAGSGAGIPVSGLMSRSLDWTM